RQLAYQTGEKVVPKDQRTTPRPRTGANTNLTKGLRHLVGPAFGDRRNLGLQLVVVARNSVCWPTRTRRGGRKFGRADLQGDLEPCGSGTPARTLVEPTDSGAIRVGVSAVTGDVLAPFGGGRVTARASAAVAAELLGWSDVPLFEGEAQSARLVWAVW